MKSTTHLPDPLRIVIAGLGRVGLVNAACLASRGHSVIGVDRSAQVVDNVNKGRSPFIDPPLEQILNRVVPSGFLRATTRLDQAMRGADIVVCCVGSPVDHHGETDLTQVLDAANAMGEALTAAACDPIIVLRSTVPPLTTTDMLIPTLEHRSGLKHGVDFHVAYVPEFLREGCSVQDFEQATRSVIGVADDATFDRLSTLLAPFSERILKTNFELAELAKLTDNAWHSLKVSFANELGNLALAAGQDGPKLLEILCQDSKLNTSSAYLRPGFAFGGPCLPKDLKILKSFARRKGVATPVLTGVEKGNDVQIERARSLVHAQQVDRIALIGPQFKSGTNRFSGSPSLELVARLHRDGLGARVYVRPGLDVRKPDDQNTAEPCALAGRGLQFSSCLRQTVAFADLILIGCINEDEQSELQDLLKDRTVLDLAGWPELAPLSRSYIGVNWPARMSTAGRLEGPHLPFDRNRRSRWLRKVRL